MRLDGVKDVAVDIQAQLVTVTYEDTKVNFDQMAKVLKKRYFPVVGKPQYLK